MYGKSGPHRSLRRSAGFASDEPKRQGALLVALNACGEGAQRPVLDKVRSGPHCMGCAAAHKKGLGQTVGEWTTRRPAQNAARFRVALHAYVPQKKRDF